MGRSFEFLKLHSFIWNVLSPSLAHIAQILFNTGHPRLKYRKTQSSLQFSVCVHLKTAVRVHLPPALADTQSAPRGGCLVGFFFQKFISPRQIDVKMWIFLSFAEKWSNFQEILIVEFLEFSFQSCTFWKLVVFLPREYFFFIALGWGVDSIKSYIGIHILEEKTWKFFGRESSSFFVNMGPSYDTLKNGHFFGFFKWVSNFVDEFI
jgi:hypothetical protein